jgi:hypothetical protein
MKVLQLLLVVAALFGIGLAVPVPEPQFLQLGQQQPFFQRPNRPRPFLRPGGILSGLLANGQQQPQPAVPATPAVEAVPQKTPEAVVPAPVTPVASPTGEVAAIPDASAAPKNPGSLFTPGGSTESNNDINKRKRNIFFLLFFSLIILLFLSCLLCKVLGMLNGGQFGSATAGGAGNGAVQGALANGNY